MSKRVRNGQGHLFSSRKAPTGAHIADESAARTELHAQPQPATRADAAPYSSPDSTAPTARRGRHARQNSTDSAAETRSSADEAVNTLHQVDDRVNRARTRLLSDPDTLGDKVLKSALPSLAGAIGGKIFQSAWDRTVTRQTKDGDQAARHQQGLFASIVFAAISAAFGAVISEISTRGTNAYVARRQHKRK